MRTQKEKLRRGGFRRWTGRFSFPNEIFTWTGQKTRQQSSDSFQQNPLLRTERVLALALHVEISDLASGNFHRDQDFCARAGNGYLSGMRWVCILQQRR